MLSLLALLLLGQGGLICEFSHKVQGMFVDVHTHLTHEQFKNDWQMVIQNAVTAGLSAIVVNGLEPKSNRQILKLSQQFHQIWPALGIYPTEAINRIIPEQDLHGARFDVDEEIDFIDQMAREKKCLAIGECGLDGYMVGEDTFAEQERVFVKLIEVAVNHDLPLIIHTRKREKRAMEILKYHDVQKVDFHCYGGKVKWALKEATEQGWYFSIPANARRNESFIKMLKDLPLERILTETDAPYLGPVRGERNEPKNVVGTVAFLAELRQISELEARKAIWKNFCSLFGEKAFS